MVGNARGAAALGQGGSPDAGIPDWDRFARWPRLLARVLLAVLAALLVAAALVPIEARKDEKTAGFVENLASAQPAEGGRNRERDADLALYDRAIERIARGENYYDFIAGEHRAADYPVTPGLAVRLPTLAYLDAWLGVPGQIAASILLMLGTLAAWWGRLRQEPGGPETMRLAMALCLVGVSLGTNRYFFTLHELWSGMLLALAFGLYRPARDGVARWLPAFLAAALALAIREHALPFVLLMAAMAFWRREWREGVAWTLLSLAFLTALAIHLQIIAAQVLPTDRPSAPWLVMRGLSGWLSNVVLSSNLRFLPHWLAGPAVILMMAGWAGWRSPAGVFGTLLYAGYGVLFMAAGRGDNYYWGAMVAPAMFIGLAFAPRALASLLRAAR